MFLEVSDTIGNMKIDQPGRERAASAFRRRMGSRSAQWIADVAGIPDASTVREFMDGKTWPRSATRRRLERVAGMDDGELENIARGDVDPVREIDPVRAALDGSPLLEWRRNAVWAEYQRHFYEQEGREVAG